MMQMASDTVRKTITFPIELAKMIEELAKSSRRSFSTQVIIFLEEEMPEWWIEQSKSESESD